MAQNDYFVIVYQVLKYLYECLKKGEKPEACHLTASAYNIHENYWQYIILSLITEEYVKGIAVNHTKDGVLLGDLPDARGCKIENTCAIEYGIPVIEDYTAE